MGRSKRLTLPGCLSRALDREDLPCTRNLHARCPVPVEEYATRKGLGEDGQVPAVQNWFNVGVVERVPPSNPHKHVGIGSSVLALHHQAVGVVEARNIELFSGLEHGTRKWTGIRGWLHSNRAALPTEHGAIRRWQACTGRDAVLEGTGETFEEVAARRKGEGAPPQATAGEALRPASAPDDAGAPEDESW